MTDTFQNYTSGLQSPATHVANITPDDATDLAVASRALNVAQGGAVQVTTVGGTTATITVAAGVVMPVRVIKIWQTGTTATGITVLY